MTSKLDHLRTMTTVVADTGDLDAVRALRPEDCTTNPSIVLKAVENPAFADTFKATVARHRTAADPVRTIALQLTVGLGAALAALIPGRVSTEVDARLSFDRDGSVAKGLELVEAYQRLGIGTDRILIKLAATWEGISAARELERQGVNCNLTLLFSFAQARACADAGVFLISPFVGRITDWHAARQNRAFSAEEDPGVLSVRRIYDYYKANGYRTSVMGASFRTVEQIEGLAGCDRLTIAPALLQQLSEQPGPVPRMLFPNVPGAEQAMKPSLSEPDFRWELNEDPMATEKLAEGIRNFHTDTTRLFALIRQHL